MFIICGCGWRLRFWLRLRTTSTLKLGDELQLELESELEWGLKWKLEWEMELQPHKSRELQLDPPKIRTLGQNAAWGSKPRKDYM